MESQETPGNLKFFQALLPYKAFNIYSMFSLNFDTWTSHWEALYEKMFRVAGECGGQVLGTGSWYPECDSIRF